MFSNLATDKSGNPLHSSRLLAKLQMLRGKQLPMKHSELGTQRFSQNAQPVSNLHM